MTFVEKEERFFALVQEAAARWGAKFFMDTSEGRDLETADLYCEDLSGWLIPLDQADAFFADWHGEKDLAEWDSFFVFAKWKEHEGSVGIDFASK